MYFKAFFQDTFLGIHFLSVRPESLLKVVFLTVLAVMWSLCNGEDTRDIVVQ